MGWNTETGSRVGQAFSEQCGCSNHDSFPSTVKGVRRVSFCSQGSLVGALCFSRGKLDFSPAEGRSGQGWALALGPLRPVLKRVYQDRVLSRNAEALLPSAQAPDPDLKIRRAMLKPQNLAVNWGGLPCPLVRVGA